MYQKQRKGGNVAQAKAADAENVAANERNRRKHENDPPREEPIILRRGFFTLWGGTAAENNRWTNVM